MLKVIIMAAGEGTRMKSSTSKVLHKLLNREMIKYVVDASRFEDSKTIIIAGKNKKQIEEFYIKNLKNNRLFHKNNSYSILW